MNRREEYLDLMQELEQPVPALEQTLDRAHKKNVRRKRIIRPMVNIAASFAVFVLLVNFCTPVAYACSKIPILRELAEAVTFSRSLSDAVDHEYVQPLYLSQTDGDVSATVEYLIVDQKQVNVFFRLNSDIYTDITADPVVLSADGSHLKSCSYGPNEWDVPNGELQSITIDFIDEDVPDSLRLQLDIRDMGNEPDDEATVEIAPESSFNALFEDITIGDTAYIAHFDFLLEFDPEFTATGKVYPINQTIDLEGQKITFTDMEVYPTHLRVNIADSPNNTAWLKMLYFYIETDRGMTFDTITNGITATGSGDSQSMTSFRADSSYFYEADHLKIVITGAEWLNKDMEKIHVNLKTGETETLPEGVELHSVTQEAEGWILEFQAAQRKPGYQHQLFSPMYYDAEETKYDINSWQSMSGDKTENEETNYFCESFALRNYPYEEVWLCPHYSHEWTAEEPITILVH